MSETITKSSGNVFADLGLPDPDAHQAKAFLVSAIGDAITALGLTQSAAAKLMDMSQPDVSKMLNGQFRPLSLERLLGCLRALGHDVEIAVHKPKGGKPLVRDARTGSLRVRAVRPAAKRRVA